VDEVIAWSDSEAGGREVVIYLTLIHLPGQGFVSA
jgi:hypothetical protein